MQTCRDTVGDRLRAVYLHGSLVLGRFNPNHSDIDILVVIRSVLTASQRMTLVKFLLAHSGNPVPLEITFVTVSQLFPWRYPTPFDFHYSEKWRSRLEDGASNLDLSGSDVDLAAQIMLINRLGMTLYGPAPVDVLPEVPWSDFESSLVADFDWASERLADNPRRVLDMCRAYFQISTHTIGSKDDAARWCLEALPADNHPVIQEALDVYRGNREENRSSLPELELFRRFIRAQLEHALDQGRARGRDSRPATEST